MKFMIHTCENTVRLNYIDRFLVPSMVYQGIPEQDILIWKDDHHWGNLYAFANSMKHIGNTEDMDDGIWHIQDDVLLSERFYNVAKKHDGLVAYGFCNELFDGGNCNCIGKVSVARSWASFQCIYIPNRYAKEFSEWFFDDVIPDRRYTELTDKMKHDDTIFKLFLAEKHPNDAIVNIYPCMVDHIDYILGGTTLGYDRGKDPSRKAYFWEENHLNDALKTALGV